MSRQENGALFGSIVDGTVEESPNGTINLPPKRDPLAGAVKEVVERVSLIDGVVEQVEIVVLPPIPPVKGGR